MGTRVPSRIINAVHLGLWRGHEQLLNKEPLPSLQMIPGLTPVFSLPGDRMFQATEVTNGCQRPAILHADVGAKAGMERSLASIAPEGWLPMAAAMLGTVNKPPLWANVGLRPVVGTTIDFKVLPPILSERENLLMLSCWQQWDPTSVPGSALSQWLVGIEVAWARWT